MYVRERDISVEISSVTVVDDDVTAVAPPVVPGEASSTVVSEWSPFQGSGATLSEGGVLEHPTSAQSWAGFNAVGTDIYPFTFVQDGTIEFTARLAEEGDPATIFFELESGAYPNHKPVYSTAVANDDPDQSNRVVISSTEDQTFTVNINSSDIYNYNEFHSLLLKFETRDVGIIIGDVTINDDAYATRPSFDNGVRFQILDKEHSSNVAQDTDIFLSTPWVEVDTYTPTQYSVTLPAYNGEFGFSSDTQFKEINMYLAGRDQAMIVRDVQVSVGSSGTYGGTGDQSIVFGNAFQFDRAEEDSTGDGEYILGEDDELYTFYHSSGSADWGGAAATGAPFGSSGAVMNETITVTFTAALSNYEFDDPVVVNGEEAFGADGSIDLSVDTAVGDADNPRRWSGWTNWYYLEGDLGKGDIFGGDNWNDLSLLSASWSVNGDGEEVLTLEPNTGSYYTWQQEGETDGNRYLEQELRVIGTENTSQILGKTVNFSGTVDVLSLDLNRYTVTAFVKCVDNSIVDGSDSATPVYETVILDDTGVFSLSVDMPAYSQSQKRIVLFHLSDLY